MSWIFLHFSDSIYFHLPAREGVNRTVYGVACYRQIESKVYLCNVANTQFMIIYNDIKFHRHLFQRSQ